MTTANGHKSIRQQLDEGAVLKALQIGSKRAVRMHKLMGNSIAVVRDGKLVEIPPEEITIDDTSPGGAASLPRPSTQQPKSRLSPE